MEPQNNRKKALKPGDLPTFFVSMANAGDVEGLVALYEPDAVLVIDKKGNVAVGRETIRNFYTNLLKKISKFAPGEQRPVFRNGNLALTSSRLVNGTVTAEVALPPDGTWLWAIDQPGIAIEEIK